MASFVTAYAAEDAVSEDKETGLYYTVEDNAAVITGYNSSAQITAKLFIPSQLGGYPVAKIGEYAFKNCEHTEIVIPAGVRELGKGAFSHTHVIRFKFAESSELKVIPEYCFAYSDASEIKLPETVTTIKGAAFCTCKNLSEFSIPDSVTVLEMRTIKYGVDDGDCSIIYNTFYNINYLHIGSKLGKVTYLVPDEDYADLAYQIDLAIRLRWFGAVKRITVSEENKYYTVRDNALYNKSMTKLIDITRGGDQYLTLPETVNAVYSDTDAFASYPSITEEQIYMECNPFLCEKEKILFYRCGSGFKESYKKMRNRFSKYYKGQNNTLELVPRGCVASNVFTTNKGHKAYTAPCKKCGKIITVEIDYRGKYSYSDKYSSDHIYLNGFIKLDGYWHYFNKRVPVRGVKKINGSYYYFDIETGVMYNKGMKVIGKKTYFYGSDGKMQKGLLKQDSKWYYFNYAMRTGLQKLKNGKWYYFNSKGVMQRGCKIIIGKKNYYFAKNGALTKIVQVKRETA